MKIFAFLYAIAMTIVVTLRVAEAIELSWWWIALLALPVVAVVGFLIVLGVVFAWFCMPHFKG